MSCTSDGFVDLTHVYKCPIYATGGHFINLAKSNIVNAKIVDSSGKEIVSNENDDKTILGVEKETGITMSTKWRT